MDINYLYVSYIRMYVCVGMLVVKKGNQIRISFVALLYCYMVRSMHFKVSNYVI